MQYLSAWHESLARHVGWVHEDSCGAYGEWSVDGIKESTISVVELARAKKESRLAKGQLLE
jgi:hypothetical protein